MRDRGTDGKVHLLFGPRPSQRLVRPPLAITISVYAALGELRS
jgi:hypothetical protein